MFRTKSDVDRHVQESLRKLKSEKERNLRCYNIAQQYYKVRAYEDAKNFLSLYLSVKEDSPLAHKLQGLIYEGLGDKNRALNAYKTSLEYEANQPELVLKMCELLCDTDVAMDTDRAHYWCERGSDLFPHDPAVFRLKEKLLKLGGKANTQAFEELINSEMKARPNDVNVRTRLMRLYLETGRTKAAYNHAVELEASQTFSKELVWYECFAQVCQSYADEFPSQVDWQVYCTWVSVLDRVASLSLSDLTATKKIVDCATVVFSMDQTLFKAAKATASREHYELHRQFSRHMSAQLCFHISTLILKRAKKEASNWREATRAVSPLLFLALSPPPDLEAPWCLALRPQLKHSLAIWACDATYRVSQAGYTLLAFSKDAGNQFTEKVTHMATGNWRETAFQKIFVWLDHRAGLPTSHFVQSEYLAKVSVRLPSQDSGLLRTRELVPVYEKVRDLLHHLVWLGLETAKHNDNKLPPDFHTYSFTRLKLTTHNLSNTSPETLCVLDVDAFLYATVLCAAAILEEDVKSGFYKSDRPLTLPADISNFLCTQEQMSWWVAAQQVNSQRFSSSTNLVVMRQQLQRGLEAVRVDGSNLLDVMLIIKLARTFSDRAANVTGKAGDQAALENRASLYWNAALPMLERIERNKAGYISTSKLFEYPKKELTSAEVSNLLEEGRYFVACQFMKSEQYERAIEAFKPLRSGYASFSQALIYKKLASAELEERPREEITSEMRSKHVILLTKARECLNLTWERIRIDRRHPLHQTLPEHISEVETALSRIEPDPDMDRNLLGTPRSLDFSMHRIGMSFHSSNLNRSDGEANISEASVSSVSSPAAGDMGLHPHSGPRQNGQAHRHASTPRRHHHSHQDYRRHTNNGELVDVGQLWQIQTLHEEVKKIHEKIEIIMDSLNELRRDVNKPKGSGAGDLYLFGDEEEYPEEVLSGQYPPTFVPTYPAAPQPTPSYYSPAPRGVQGTSTVTYGAPPPTQPPSVIPIISMRVPLDPTLAAYQTPQNLAFYNQAPLPFTESQHLPDFLRPTIPKPVIPQQPPPVNVVITTSDTLPTGPPPVQPTLSVTIPPQHRLGTIPVSTPPITSSASAPPHKFQIAMPATATIPNLEKSPIVIPDEVDSEDDHEVGYDPCPDFRPIIPLPNEVSVKTGEEDDDVLFENRAKLFRFVEKEWKERGVGNVKILKTRATHKARLLMRRDQVHKVCANHLLKSDMELTMLKNSDRALVWVANDFAEEVVQIEKFCIKFKTPEEAIKFKDVFNDAKTKYGQSPLKPKSDKNPEPSKRSSVAVGESKPTESTVKVNVGGFTFTSPPKLKVPEKSKPQDENNKESLTTPSPFAAFTFTPQRPVGGVSAVKLDGVLKQPLLSTPLFAGLNSTQNKHTLFLDDNEEDLPQHSDITKDSLYKVTNETSPKTIFKEPMLPSVQPVYSGLVVNNEDSNKTENTQKPSLNEPAKTQPLFNFTPQTPHVASALKETPKSILKEPPSTPLVGGSKASPSAKHVLFQDTAISPSQQTPTLAALLTTPKTPVVDFAALSKMNENKEILFGSENKTSGFEGAGTAVFSNNRVRNDSEGENGEEFVPSAEFKPVVPLPELIDVKTGEEGQEVLFNERAKLMRFDSSTKEWKERGLGQMKILKDPVTGVARFLMRREQVFKVCCNHRIIQSIELKASPSSEKAWTWYAVDYAESEPKNELLAIRFKTVELAKEFKETVDTVQKQLREEGTSKRSCPDTTVQEEDILPSSVWHCQFCLFPNSTTSRSCKACSKSKGDPNALPKLSELFRPKTGSWECKACYTVNGIKDGTCVSCDTPKEKPKSPAPEKSAAPAPSLAEMFKPKVGSWECKECYTINGIKDNICVSCESPKEKPKSPVSEKSPTPAPSLAEMFKPKVGSWECSGCLVRNDAGKTICPACSTPKPGHEGDVKEPSKTAFGSSSFSFCIKPDADKGTGFSFGIKPNEDIPNSSFTFGIKTEATTPKVLETAQSPTFAPNFKSQSTENKDSEKITTAATGFTFSQDSTPKAASPFIFAPKSEVVASSADSTTATSLFETKPSETMFKFGNLIGDSTSSAKTSFLFGSPTSNSSQDAAGQFAFGMSGKFEFNFSGVKTPRSPGSQSGGSKSPRSPGADNETDSENDEADEEEDHIVFQPVVPLPDKVPLTTGEENEAVLYCHRSKLYRFVQGEWKERGVGDIKILRHNDTHKIRLLMRREPILKICLNHFLTTDLTFSPKDDKSWLWSAQDFSDGQLTNEQFCLRFKSPEIAAEFKAAVESAQGELEGATCVSKTTTVDSGTTSSVSDTHDVEVVYEARVSETLRQAALRLQLPPNFYSYLDAAPCPGCVGCESDSEEETAAKLQTTASDVSLTKTAGVNLPSVPSTTVSQPFTFTVDATKSTTVPSQPFTFTVKTTATTFTTASSVFSIATTKQQSSSSTPLLSTPAPVQSSFSFSLNTTSASTKTTSLFGASSQPVSTSQTTSFFGGAPLIQSQSFSKPLFGETPVFGSTPTIKAGTALLFGTTASTQSATTLTFGSALNTTPSMFGGSPSNQTPKGTPLFNNLSTAPSSFGGVTAQSPASVFGSPTPTLADSASPIGSSFFNNMTTFQSPQTSLFGGLSSPSPSSLFGTPTNQNQPPVFGTPKNQSQSLVFGTPKNQNQPPIFGTATTQSQSSVFGTATTQSQSSVFGTATTQSQSSVFGTATTHTDTPNTGPTFLFKPTTSFSDIAAISKPTSFESDKANFSWVGAGSTVFGGKLGTHKKTEEESEGESGGEEAEAETSHDPVFEPIVPLPDTIVVRTGEEEEEKEFCSRAKFYRYVTDTKEWKERGVGEMKILRHREHNTYRLLLRREQVHKVVCNQLILADLELQTLANSDKSFCWAGMNMAEEYNEPQLEKVAVRFKYSEIAKEFKAKLEQCIAAVRTRKEAENVEPAEDVLEPAVTIEEVSTEYSEGEGEEEDYLEGESLEGEETEPLFEKRATLYTNAGGSQWSRVSQGELMVLYSHDMNTSSMMFKRDDGGQIILSANPETSVQINEKEVSWCGLGYDQEDTSDMQQYKAEFSSTQAAQEFVDTLNETAELATLNSYDYLESGQED